MSKAFKRMPKKFLPRKEFLGHPLPLKRCPRNLFLQGVSGFVRNSSPIISWL